jgi:hypothetical protein
LISTYLGRYLYIYLGKIKFYNQVSGRLEAYLYDLKASPDEADDPLEAVIFSWPPRLPEDHVLLVAGHLVSSKLRVRYQKPGSSTRNIVAIFTQMQQPCVKNVAMYVGIHNFAKIKSPNSV